MFFIFENNEYLIYAIKKRKKCPSCGSFLTIKKGFARGVQTYLCLVCAKRFSSQRRIKTILTKHLWKEYVFGKQTTHQLQEQYQIDKRNIRHLFDEYTPPQKRHHPRPIHLVIDGTYFGERKEDTSWCVIVAREAKQKEDLLWSFCKTETTYAYVLIREELESLGYTILSVTGDGFSGIKSAFSSIPYQMCHVHMERLVIRGTTRNPKTEAGEVLLALTKTLHKNTKKELFKNRLKHYIEKYKDFLNEKTIHPISGEKSWTHEDLRRSVFCLIRHAPYLFTYKQNTHIPRTTNSLEGHFKHVKKMIAVHNGLSRPKTQKILTTIFLASTVSPNKKRLEEVL